MRRLSLVALMTTMYLAQSAAALAQAPNTWMTSWAASVHGPYPVGNATAQPDLSLVFPSAEIGARDQTFRLIVRPDIWGPATRVRLSNAFGTRPITFDGVYVGLQLSGSAVVLGTTRPVLFGGERSITIAPGGSVWSDAVNLEYWRPTAGLVFAGRKLAVSFHVAGQSGPMTWHAKALTTSYVTDPGAGSHGQDEREDAFCSSTTSWYFLDAVDMMASPTTRVVVAFGDSITDGTASTLNGDDRWPDVLARRLHAMYGDEVSVVNAGIGGNRVAGPATYSAQQPFSGGPAAGPRLERDVLSLSGVFAVIWLEGINDFSAAANTRVDAVEAEMRAVVARMRARRIRVLGATLTSSVGSAAAGAEPSETTAKRLALNEFIRTAGLFDGVFDFDKATLDPATGAMREAMVPNSTVGGAGDHLHPNRLGYAAMGHAVDLKLLMGP